ncbi:MAG: hypothetical protein K5886_08920 [Lachnospiraceae bacterium]|nr:hypothetical protein [Lachnospiraceae bacterium]
MKKKTGFFKRSTRRPRITAGLCMMIILSMVLTACGGGTKSAAGAGSSDPLVGVYIPVTGELGGMAIVGSDLEGFGLELTEGGKGTLTADGSTAKLKWSADGSTVTIKAEGETMTAQAGNDTLVFDDMLGTGMKFTFAKEGSAAADPALYLPEEEKYLIGEWQSVEVTDVLGDPIDPSEMAPDAFSITFRGDHTADVTIEGKEYKDLPWSNLGDFGSIDSDDIELSWEPAEDADGINADYVRDGTYFTFFCPKGGAAAVKKEDKTEEKTESPEEKSDEETEEHDIPDSEEMIEEESEKSEKTQTGSSKFADYWDKDWYGWYELENCRGEYEKLEGARWDCAGAIFVNDDDTGSVFLFDEDGSVDDLFCACDVSFLDGVSSCGCMQSEEGSFWTDKKNIGHADWSVEPEISDFKDFKDLICISSIYEDEDGKFRYYIYLKPWGEDWEDVREFDEQFLPESYDSWYLDVKDDIMPDEIGG